MRYSKKDLGKKKNFSLLMLLLLLFLGSATLTLAQEQATGVEGTPGSTRSWAVVEWKDLVRLSAVMSSLAKPGGQEAPIHPLPPPKEVPASLLGKEAPQPTTTLTTPSPEPQAPPLQDNFEALFDNGLIIPPDTMGVAGPNHLMVTLNSEVRIQDKTGTDLGTVSHPSFWSSVATFPFDPKILFDEDSGRYIFAAVAEPQSSSSAVLLGVSATNDPTGTWFLRSFDADSANIYWADFPSLSVNQKWIVISANMFRVSNNLFGGPKMWVFDKAQAIASGGAITPTIFSMGFDNTGSGSNHTIQGCLTYGTEPNLYMVDTGWFSGSTELVRLSQLSGTASSPSWSLINWIAITDFSFTILDAPQAGTSQLVDTGDYRVANAAVYDGSVRFTHTGGLPDPSPNRTAVFWHEIDPLTSSVIQEGVVDGGAGISYYYPSIAVNDNHDVALGFSGSSSTSFISAYYTGRTSTDPLNTMQTVALLKAGEAKYFKTFGSGRNRWGDYSATCVDPSDGLTFWTIQEYAGTPVGSGVNDDRWGTWWGKFSFFTPPPPVSVTTTPDSTIISRGGILSYRVMLTNETDTSQTFQFWTNVTLPNGNIAPSGRELLGPVTVTLGPHAFRSAHPSHTIPMGAPLGAYIYHAYVGTHPTADNQSDFDFDVVSP